MSKLVQLLSSQIRPRKAQLSALGDKVNYMSPSKAVWDPVGGRHHTSQETFSISNYKDSVKSPAATLSGFLGLGVSVATLLWKWTDGQGTGMTEYGHWQPASTPRHQPSAKLSPRAQEFLRIQCHRVRYTPSSKAPSQKLIMYEKKIEAIGQMVSISRLIKNNFPSHGAENICK